MRWRRRRKPNGREAADAAMAAVAESTQKLEALKKTQPRVDRVAARLDELGRRDRFAEAVEAAMRRRQA